MNPECQTEFSRLRLKTGKSIDELSGILGCSKRTLARYECGESNPRRPVIDRLKSLNETPYQGYGEAGFRFIDLFAGIGGLRKGFDAIGGKCVFTSEWNQYSRQTYAANFHDGDDHVMEGDITKVPAEAIPSHDVLLAGFPCQPFSVAGAKNTIVRKQGFRYSRTCQLRAVSC